MTCIADPTKIRIIAKIEGEVQNAFPYLNRVREDAVYNQAIQTITIKEGEKIITIHPIHITMTMIQDEKEAVEMLEKLKELINSTYERRTEIEPLFEMRESLKVKEILKYLPLTNCRACGERSCFAFAYKFLKKEIELERCSEILKEEYVEKRQALFEILKNQGHYVREFSNP
jgi:ArsR family metal-binding transcriptional regulator